MYAPHTPLMNMSAERDRLLACADRQRDAAIDDFWRGADAVLQRSLHTGQAALERSAQRLQVRLRRCLHRKVGLEG